MLPNEVDCKTRIPHNSFDRRLFQKGKRLKRDEDQFNLK